MSAEHVGWAFRQPLPATRKFVLVALADRCNKDTRRCDPSVNRLAEDTGLNRATVIRALAALEEEGYIQRVPRTAKSNAYVFPILEGSRTVRPPQSQSATPPSRTVRPEPEVEPEVEPIAAAPRARQRDPIWDTLVDIFGMPAAPTEIRLRGKTVRNLRMAKATPEEIIRRARSWPQHFDTATLTPEALEKHWTALGRKPLRRR